MLFVLYPVSSLEAVSSGVSSLSLIEGASSLHVSNRDKCFVELELSRAHTPHALQPM